jgi:hypothetical protein
VSLPPEDRLQALAAFMAERHAIYMRKAWLEDKGLQGAGGMVPRMGSRMAAGWGQGSDLAGPYQGGWGLEHLTDNPILRRFRFCNVYRELDRVTVWIRENIREPFADHEHLWFMLCVARHFNWPDTLQDLMDGGDAWPSDRPCDRGFRPDHMTSVLWQRQVNKLKVYTGAYMIRAEQHDDKPWRHWPKVRYSSEIVLGRLWEARNYWELFLRQGDPNTMQEIWNLFQHPQYVGWGPFMAYQVVVDMRWTRYLRGAPDINEWAAVGPGSARGLNRLHGRPLKSPVSQGQGLEEMQAVRAWMQEGGLAAYPWLDVPELSDVQNCLCEFDKYERVRLGEGRPRALYVPGRGS